MQRRHSDIQRRHSEMQAGHSVKQRRHSDIVGRLACPNAPFALVAR
jgi:hypothetical protein